MHVTTLEQLASAGRLSGRRVFIRADLNVPFDDAGRISEDTRIRGSVRGIRMALDAGAAVMVTSHLGRPTEGELRPEDSLARVVPRLAELLGRPVPLIANWIDGVKVAPGELVLLENCRVNPGEKKDSDALARRMAQLADVYVNDAFGTAHRAEATTHGMAKYAPIACAGPLMAAEIEALGRAFGNPRRPLVAIVAGSKVSTKLTVLDNLAQRVDRLIVGGGIANTFLLAQGFPIGASLAEPGLIPECRKVLATLASKGATLPLPIDVVVARECSAQAAATVRRADDVREGEMILDIGPQSALALASMLHDAGTIIWNGPVGVFEFDAFADGTHTMALAIAEATARGALSIAGGGAFLEFLEGKPLPAIEVLEARAETQSNLAAAQ